MATNTSSLKKNIYIKKKNNQTLNNVHRAANAFVAESLAGSKINSGEPIIYLEPKAYSQPYIRKQTQ